MTMFSQFVCLKKTPTKSGNYVILRQNKSVEHCENVNLYFTKYLCSETNKSTKKEKFDLRKILKNVWLN